MLASSAAIFWTLKTSAPLFLLGALAFGQGFLVTYRAYSLAMLTRWLGADSTLDRIVEGIATIRAMWDEGTAMCVVYKWDSTVLAIFYIYSASFAPPPPASD